MNEALNQQEAVWQQIESNPRFQELVHKRQSFALLLSIIMLVLYVGFILLIAFAPGWLGTPLHEGTNVTRGIPIGVGLIVVSFLLTGIYLWPANAEFNLPSKQTLTTVNS